MPKIPAARIVLLMPTWLGDAVMATPFLRALATLYPHAHIAAVARPLAAPVLAGLSYVQEVYLADRHNPAATARYLRTGRFDMGIALPNAFRAAWSLFRARIPQRLGYARDWRAPLLTHTLTPQRRALDQRSADLAKRLAIRQISRELGRPQNPRIGSPYQPTPAIDYYLALAEYLGAHELSKHMELAITDEERAQAAAALATLAIPSPTWVTLIPGANFGSSKCYPPEHFAAVATTLIQKYGTSILLAGSPAEAPILQAIIEHATTKATGVSPQHFLSLPALNHGQGIPLGALKELIRRSKLVLCNDTGPRHFAAAFNVPTITLFGPTDPRWAETLHPNERILRVNVPCGPCQLKKCPIDHRCLRGLTPEMVLAAAAELLG